MEGNVLDQPNRRKIFEFIENNPGIRMREISRGCGIYLGTVEHHVHELLKAKLINVEIDERQKRFFVWSTMAGKDKSLLWALRRETPRILVGTLLDRFMAGSLQASRGELVTITGLNQSSVSDGLSFLVKRGIVALEQKGRERFYSLKDPDTIREALEVIKGKTNLANHHVTQGPDKASGTI